MAVPTQKPRQFMLPTMYLMLRMISHSLAFLVEFTFGLIIFSLLVLAFIFSTQWGRETLLDEGIKAGLVLTPFTFDVEDVSSETADVWQIGRFALRYQDNLLLEVRRFELRIHWRTILDHQIKLAKVAAGHIWLEGDASKWPSAAESPEVEPEDEKPTQPLPDWLNDWRADLELLEITELTVQHPALPEPLRANLFVSGVRLSHIAANPPGITLENLALTLNDGSQWVTGHYVDEAINASVKLDHFPLDILALVMDDFNTGWLSADLSVRGPLLNPAVAGRVQTDTQLLNMPLVAKTEIGYEALKIKFKALEGRWDNLVVKGYGAVDLTTHTLDILIERAAMPIGFIKNFKVDLPPQLKLNVSASNVKVTGPFTDVRYVGAASGKGLYGKVPLSFKAWVNGGVTDLRLQNTTLQAGSLNASLNGHLDFSGPLSVESRFSGLTNQLVAELVPNLPPELLSSLAYSGQGSIAVNGTLATPTVKAEVAVDGTYKVDGAYKEEPLHIHTQASGSLRQVDIASLTVRLDPNQAPVLSANGQINLAKKRLNLALDATELPLWLAALSGATLPEGLSGNLNLRSSVQGPWGLPNITALANMAGNFNKQPYRLDLDGNFTSGALAINTASLQLNGDKIIDVDGTLSAETQTLELSLAAFDLKHLEPFGVKDIQGVVDATIRYEGDQHTSGIAGKINYAINWEVTREDGKTEVVPIQFATDIQTDHTPDISARVTKIDTRILKNGQQASALHARVPIKPYRDWILAILSGEKLSNEKVPDIPTQMAVSGDLELAMLQSLAPNYLDDFSGLATLNVEAQGTLKAPALIGQVNLAKGHYANQLTGTNLSNIGLAITLDGQRVRISEGNADTPDGGNIKLSGDASWAEDRSVDVKLIAKNAILLERPDIEAALNGNLNLKGDKNGYLLAGRINLQPLTLNINSSFDGVPEIQVNVIEKPDGSSHITMSNPTAEKTSAFPLELDLVIVADQQAFLRGRGLTTELKGEVKITGNASKLRCIGAFKTIRGNMQLFGKRFQLVRGTAEFDGANVILNIVAEYTGREETFRVQVSGTLDDFKLALTSDPVLPQDEVLARLLFGISVKNITPVQAVQLITAVQTLQGGNSLLPDPISFTRDLVGVDELNVASVDTDQGKGVAVGFGKYLSESVYFEVERTSDPKNPWQGKLDIELRPNLYLETTTAGAAGDQVVELLWKNDY